MLSWSVWVIGLLSLWINIRQLSCSQFTLTQMQVKINSPGKGRNAAEHIEADMTENQERNIVLHCSCQQFDNNHPGPSRSWD